MTAPEELTEPDRRALRIEIAVVLAVTFGLSAYTAVLELVEAILLNLSAQIVALNPRLSPFDLINLGLHLARVAQLVAWGALGLYLLWRSGFGPGRIGLGPIRLRPDVLGGLGLAALVGLPGLGLYLAARALGMSVSVVPSALNDTWWRVPVLIALAFANGWAEEVIVVAFCSPDCNSCGSTRSWRWSPRACCAGRITSTRAGVPDSATRPWAWFSATRGGAPGGCGRWSSLTA